MRNKTILIFLFSLTLLAFISLPASVQGQEAPSVRVQANAPGWITVLWEHTGEDVYYFLIQRQDAPYTDNSIVNLAQSQNRTDSLTDKNLKANTVYNYRVCAVYADSPACTDWVSARTLSPPPPPSSGGSPGGTPPARTPLATPEITASRDQDPKHILLDWSGDPGWQEYETRSVFHYDGTPWERTTYKHPQLNNVVIYRGLPGTSKFTSSVYDARKEEGPIWYGYLHSLLSVTLTTVRANFVYTFKACFTSRDDETKCSKEITASGKPVVPTAPADVTVSQDKFHLGQVDRSRIRATNIGTAISAHWRNTAIPGQFITLEQRDDRVQFVQRHTFPAWIEIKRISSSYVPVAQGQDVPQHDEQGSTTELTVDVTDDAELLAQRGNSYRICAVVPALGAQGRVCSPAVSLQMVNSRTDPQSPKDDAVRPDGSKRIKGRDSVLKDSPYVLTPKKPE